jgi:hypothetical protein
MDPITDPAVLALALPAEEMYEAIRTTYRDAEDR